MGHATLPRGGARPGADTRHPERCRRSRAPGLSRRDGPGWRRRGGVDLHPEASPVTVRTLPSPRRALRMVQRNLLVYKHTWLVIVSGFFEPVFYLAGIGVGLGALVPDIEGVNYA